MKIGISTSVIQRGQSGLARYVVSLLRSLIENGCDHHFVLFVLENDLDLFEFARGAVELVPVPEKQRAPLADILWHQATLPRLAATHGLDVLHVPSYRRMLGRAPCPRVATVHDLAAFHVPRKYDWKRMFYGRVIAAHLARQQEELIAVSETTASDMATFWAIPRHRVTVIHHGIDLTRFSPCPPAAAAPGLLRRGGSAPFFLYVSRLEHPGKNHVRLLTAFERFKAETGSPWLLVLAGSDWHGAEHIHQAIARSPARNDVRCLGFVEEAELPSLYRAAGALVYPSLHEGFGLPALEAMACGCPVLCSSRGALGEVVGYAALTVDPEAIDALTSHLKRLARDKSLREALRRAGLAWSQRFDWNRAAAQTLAVYERAAARVHPHRLSRPRPAGLPEDPLSRPLPRGQINTALDT